MQRVKRTMLFDWTYWKVRAAAFVVRWDDVKLAFSIMFRPFRGFSDMKFEDRGRVNMGVYIMLLFVLIMIMQKQFTGFIVNYYDPYEFNSFDELIYVLVPFFTFCVSNWALTTLMDGEGTFREIIMSTGYAMMPMAVMYLIAMLVSNVVSWDEVEYYYLLMSIGSVWFLFLLFVGNMTIHQYTVAKTIVMLGLTLVAMFFLFFLALLFFSLVQQMIAFANTIYQEIVFRV